MKLSLPAAVAAPAADGPLLTFQTKYARANYGGSFSGREDVPAWADTSRPSTPTNSLSAAVALAAGAPDYAATAAAIVRTHDGFTVQPLVASIAGAGVDPTLTSFGTQGDFSGERHNTQGITRNTTDVVAVVGGDKYVDLGAQASGKVQSLRPEQAGSVVAKLQLTDPSSNRTATEPIRTARNLDNVHLGFFGSYDDALSAARQVATDTKLSMGVLAGALGAFYVTGVVTADGYVEAAIDFDHQTAGVFRRRPFDVTGVTSEQQALRAIVDATHTYEFPAS